MASLGSITGYERRHVAATAAPSSRPSAYCEKSTDLDGAGLSQHQAPFRMSLHPERRHRTSILARLSIVTGLLLLICSVVVLARGVDDTPMYDQTSGRFHPQSEAAAAAVASLSPSPAERLRDLSVRLLENFHLHPYVFNPSAPRNLSPDKSILDTGLSDGPWSRTPSLSLVRRQVESTGATADSPGSSTGSSLDGSSQVSTPSSSSGTSDTSSDASSHGSPAAGSPTGPAEGGLAGSAGTSTASSAAPSTESPASGSSQNSPSSSEHPASSQHVDTTLTSPASDMPSSSSEPTVTSLSPVSSTETTTNTPVISSTTLPLSSSSQPTFSVSGSQSSAPSTSSDTRTSASAIVTREVVTTGKVTTSSAVSKVVTATLENGRVTVLTSTSWVNVVPAATAAASSGSREPDLQNDAVRKQGGIVPAVLACAISLSIMPFI